ncbi:unnamed protein product [Arctogadus glacialis]
MDGVLDDDPEVNTKISANAVVLKDSECPTRYSEDDDGSSRAHEPQESTQETTAASRQFTRFIHSAEFLANGLLVDKRCRRTSGYYPKKTEYFVR